MTTQATECDVCCRRFTKTTRKGVQCQSPDCTYSACSDCVKTYLVTQTEAKCMNCQATWTRGHVAEQLGVSWAKNHLLKAQAQQLLSQQLSLLPHDAEEAAHQKKLDEFRKERTELGKRRRAIQAIRKRALLGQETEDDRSILGVSHDDDLVAVQEALQAALADAHQADYDAQLRENHYEMSRRIRGVATNPRTEPTAVAKVNCPVADCRGFANGEWKCSACETRICHECHEVTTDGHVCDENVLENIKLLKQDTKPCPTCATPIHKIDGCDQMWCVKCHTAFSWDTGRIERGTVHNPHFYAWQNDVARGVRNVGDVACGGVPDVRTFYTKMFKLMSLLSFTLFNDDGHFIHDEQHIRDVTKTQLQMERVCQLVCAFTIYADNINRSLDDIRDGLNGREERLRQMRIDFINHGIKDEAAYTRKLVKHLTDTQRDVEISMVLEMVSACIIERLRNICETHLLHDVSQFWTKLSTVVSHSAWRQRIPAGGEKYSAFNILPAMTIARPSQEFSIYDFITERVVLTHESLINKLIDKKHKADGIARDIMNGCTELTAEMVRIANYANKQLGDIGNVFSFTPEPCEVPENAVSFDVPDAIVSSVTDRGMYIMPDTHNRKYHNFEWNLIRSDLVQGFGLRI